MVQEGHTIRTLEELKGRTLEDLLREVARSRQTITVVLEEGESVTIEPASRLKLLPLLEAAPEGYDKGVAKYKHERLNADS